MVLLGVVPETVGTIYLILCCYCCEWYFIHVSISNISCLLGRLTKADRELIVVATSAHNKCLYCVVSHSALHRIYSKKPTLSDQVPYSIDFQYFLLPLTQNHFGHNIIVKLQKTEILDPNLLWHLAASHMWRNLGSNTKLSDVFYCFIPDSVKHKFPSPTCT